MNEKSRESKIGGYDVNPISRSPLSGYLVSFWMFSTFLDRQMLVRHRNFNPTDKYCFWIFNPMAVQCVFAWSVEGRVSDPMRTSVVQLLIL